MESELSCYHGSICRAEAEHILERLNMTGAFLIRNSETFIGSYTLCLWADDGYHQYRIINDRDGVYVKAEAGVEETRYLNLAALIEYYQCQDSANGLAAPLRIPVPLHSSETLYDLKKSTEVKEILTCYFQHKFRYERHSRFNANFYHSVEKYLESGLVNDLEEIQNSDGLIKEIPYFRKLILETMKALFESLNDIGEKLAFLSLFFCNSHENKSLQIFESNHFGQSYDGVDYMKQFPEFVKEIESQIVTSFSSRLTNFNTNRFGTINGIKGDGTLVSQMNTKNCVKNSDAKSINVISNIRHFKVELFDVQLVNLQMECKASVDILTGRLKLELQHCIRKSYIKQLIIQCDSINEIRKSETISRRLLIHDTSSLGYVYIDFDNEDTREEFIHCICASKRYSNMKNNNLDCLSIFIGTWNIGSSKTLENLSSWLKCQGSGKPQLNNISKYVPHDLYVVAVQEDSDDQHWDPLISSTLNTCYNEDFPLVATKSNSFPKTLKLSVFCRLNLEKYIKNIVVDAVNTGFANKCGNKGAVSISFSFQDTSFCFINCHLASGTENVKRREDDFRSILQKLNSHRNNHADLISRHDFVFCTGDLNMRTDMHVTDAMKLLQTQQSNVLLQADELRRYQQSKHWNPFKAFKEHPISHGPTYRYLRGTRDNLDPVKKKIGAPDKINSPSWCDRVLYTSRSENGIHPLSYGMNSEYKSSDHKPVFSSFLVAKQTVDYLDRLLTNSPAFVRIEEILVNISSRWKGCNKFQIQLDGVHLPEVYASQLPFAICEAADSRIYTTCQSRLKDLIKYLDFAQNIALLFISPFKTLSLRPGLSVRDIDSSHLFASLIIIGENKSECIANCSIPLRQFSKTESHSFQVELFEHSVSVGTLIIRGRIENKNSEFDTDFLKSPQRLINFYQNSYSSEDVYPGCRSLLDVLNDQDSNHSEIPKFPMKLSQNSDETSAFRPVQIDNINSINTVRHTSLKPNGFPDQTNLSKMNGMNFSSSMRVIKNKDNFEYSERQNFSDDSSNCTKFPCHTICKSSMYNHVENNSNNSNNMNFATIDMNEDSSLTAVHNEGYSAAIIRGGVSNKKRYMDARVDLSKLDAEMNNIQPPLPPRTQKRNVRPARTRQEHSNPISIASSSGSSYNANSIGDSSIASAEPSCCLLHHDSDIEEVNEVMMRKQEQTPYNRGLDDSKESGSKQSTITGSTNHICSFSGQYVQAVPTVNSDKEKFIEPYASTKIDSDTLRADQDNQNEIEYVVLQKPIDIRQWLSNMDVPHIFIEKLLSSVFIDSESIFLTKDEDLKSIGISDNLMRRKILCGINTLLNDTSRSTSTI